MKKTLSTLAVFALVATGFLVNVAPSHAANPNVCAGTHNGETFGQLIVNAADPCFLNNSTVTGQAKVNSGASLFMCNTHLGSTLKVDHGYVNIDHMSKIDGAVDIVAQVGSPPGGSGGCSMALNPSYTGFICPHVIQGPLTVHDSPSGAEFAIGECGHMDVGGSLTIVRNSVEVGVDNTDIGADLICRSNSPDAVRDTDVTWAGRIVGCPLEG